MKNETQRALQTLGPANASSIAAYLEQKLGISAEAARKRLSRVTDPIRSFPIPLLPRNEKFFYLQEQRNNEDFWPNFHRAMRSTESVFGIALDGLIARGGTVAVNEFLTVSGAPHALKNQISHAVVVERLERSHIIAVDEEHYQIIKNDLCSSITVRECRHRDLVERVLLDGIRTWARNLGLASYNSISIRGEEDKRLVGQFQWDLSGPSYLWPLKKPIGKAFLVADVFCGELDRYAIRFFIRKLQMLQQTVSGIQLLPILVASKFDADAFQKGKELGIIFATHQSLFGSSVASAIQNLLSTLNDVSHGIQIDGNRFQFLLDNLASIEGSAGNLRGILFELISYYLARIGATRVEFAQKAVDHSSGEKADIDVLRVESKRKCTCIECKGITPGKTVDIESITHWIQKIKVMKAWLKNIPDYKDSEIFFEIWTTGDFAQDTLDFLNEKKQQMRKTNLAWKNGDSIYQMARDLKETAIADALNQHFRKHPYAR